MYILLLSDIHANFPALQAIVEKFRSIHFDHIVNCGDSIVYGPFPNETLAWLESHNTLSILGNTDKKIIRLINGRSFKKPKNFEKRIMYTWTADVLTPSSRNFLLTLSKSASLSLPVCSVTNSKNLIRLGIFHGSPAAHHEFLFADSPDTRFIKLAEQTDHEIIITGHSHTPYHKYLSKTHFINPGSVGRMFDNNPKASCATLNISNGNIYVEHFRIGYPVKQVTSAISANNLPEIYSQMFLTGRKLN